MTKTAVWPTKPLGDLAEFRNGVNYDKRSFGEGIKVVGVKDFQDFTKPKYSSLEQINPEGVVTERNLLRHGDIVFVRSNGNRELIGRSLYVDNPPEPVTHSAFTIRVRLTSDVTHPEFYAYLFRTKLIRQALTAYGGGTNISNLNQDILGRLEVPVPPISIQQHIASTLSTYDDLIENNLRRIEIIEQMASALYHEWFVDFHFPGYGGCRRGASPEGPMPAEWTLGKLGDYLSALEAGRRPKGGVGGIIDGVPSVGAENINGIGRHDYGSEKYVPREYFSQMRKGVVHDRDVAIYKDGAYIGKSAYFRDGFPYSEFCVNEHVFLARSEGRRLTQNILYLWLQEASTVRTIRSTNANAAQPGINHQSLAGIELVVPDEETAQRFDVVVDPMLATIINLAQRNRVLQETRDLLLPRLLSGQISLGDA